MPKDYSFRVNHYAYNGNEAITLETEAAWVDFLTHLWKHDGFDYLLTPVFNRERSIDAAFQAIEHLFNRVNREFAGPHWAKRKDRWRGVVFLENVDTNIHGHVLVSPPYELRSIDDEKASQIFGGHWLQIAPAGNINIQRVHGSPTRVMRYITKDARRGALSGARFVGFRSL